MDRVYGSTVSTAVVAVPGSGTTVDELEGIIVLCNGASECSGKRLMEWIRFLRLTPQRFAVGKIAYNIGGFDGEVAFDDNDDIQDEISPDNRLDNYRDIHT